MTVEQLDTVGLVRELERQGIYLRAEGGTLRFDAPKGAMTAELKAELGQRRAELLRVLAAAARPLSLAQRRFWLLDQMQPGCAAYTITVALDLRGHLDPDALQRALTGLVRRHVALRTVCEVRDGEPMQVVRDVTHMSLRTVDLSTIPSTERAAEAHACERAEAQRAFDLSAAPLLRAKLLRFTADHQRLVLSTHHFAADGWSVGVLLHDLAALYAAERAGTTPLLPPLPKHYADIAAEQERALARGAWADDLRWWKAQLSGAPPLLALPTDRIRPPTESHRGAVEVGLLPPDLVSEIKTFSRRAGVTPFMTLLAGFNVLLARYSATDDIVVGTAISERSHADVEGIVGPLSNNLVLRTRVDGDPSFGELVGRVRSVAGGTYARQHVPFERLLDELRPVREPGHSPVFQVMFLAHDAAMSAPTLAGLETSWETVDNGGAKFDLHLTVVDTPEGMRASLEYATDLFDRSTMVRLLGHLHVLLSAAVAEPKRRISMLPLLDPVERERIGVEFNATHVAYPGHWTLHGLVEAQVDRTPDAIAVSDEQTRLTYRELDERANRLAHVLQAHGVGADVPVGVCLERSVDMVVALLAVLKAGGCYLPLEPTYPTARLAMMLEDARPALVLATNELRGRLPEDVELLLVDGDNRPWERASAERTTRRSGPTDLAYIIFTSGSTGRPKGVMIPHRGIANRLLWMQDEYRLAADDVVLQKTPFGFDVSVWEFFWPLMAGARLVMARPGGHRDPAYLMDVITRETVTTVHFVPSMLQLFLEEPSAGACRSLRRVVCSGEALPAGLARRFHDTLGCDLYNLYGPTEASVDVTAWRCNTPDERASVPIGWPIANTQIYILDPAQQPLPIGIPGELHIGGVGLARGYVNRPDLTAERFIADPFSSIPCARLYRTGDLARYLPDGAIDYCGRLDDQVKVRGVRIELGEVEATLATHPAVRESVVLAANIDGSQQLVGCVVAADGVAVTPADLRLFLLQRLPEAMVPTRFAFRAEVPLTPNGKADRRALAAQIAAEEPRHAAEPRARCALESPQEMAMARAWANVLGSEPATIGAEDDFFAVGGDSFKAIRLVRQLPGLAVADIFRYPTLRVLAEHVARLAAGRRPTGPGGMLVPIGRGSAKAPGVTLLCVPYGGGDVAAYGPLAAALPEDIAIRAVLLPGRDGAPATPTTDLDSVAAACVAEALSSVHGPLAVYGHCLGSALAIEIARRLEQAGRRPKAVFIGGSIPPGDGDVQAAMPLSTDLEILESLRNLGGFEEEVDRQSVHVMMTAFRADLRSAVDYFAHAGRWGEERILAPLYCIVGECDPFTAGDEVHVDRWERMAHTVHLVSLPRGGHYFLKHQAELLAGLLAQALAPSPSERDVG